jgi:hypothetical protein
VVGVVVAVDFEDEGDYDDGDSADWKAVTGLAIVG